MSQVQMLDEIPPEFQGRGRHGSAYDELIEDIVAVIAQGKMAQVAEVPEWCRCKDFKTFRNALWQRLKTLYPDLDVVSRIAKDGTNRVIFCPMEGEKANLKAKKAKS